MDKYDEAAEAWLKIRPAGLSYSTVGESLAAHFREAFEPAPSATLREQAEAAAQEIWLELKATGALHSLKASGWIPAIRRRILKHVRPDARYRLVCPRCRNPWDANHLPQVDALRIENDALKQENERRRKATEAAYEGLCTGDPDAERRAIKLIDALADKEASA